MTKNKPVTITPSLAARFWPKVDTGGNCWVWLGATSHGYGAINTGKMGRVYAAHRVSWVMANGAIPEGHHVLHTCDTPACVRPDHLFLGTDADNHADKARKGRSRIRWDTKPPRGEQHYRAKLTDAQIAEIRRRVASGERQSEVAAGFGVHQSYVSRLKLDRRRVI